MGLRNSKHNNNSYDIAPVVSNKDFIYKKHVVSLPKVELPVAAVLKEDNQDLPETARQKETTTGLVIETRSGENAIVEDKNEIQGPYIPDWVNKNKFKKLLLKTHPNIKDIIAFRVFPALTAGENYCSLMLRIKITANFENSSTEDFCYMLKVGHDTNEVNEMFMNFFVIENTVYTEVIPELVEMYHRAGLQIKFAPESYRLELDNDNIQYVLMDDLSVDGYKNINRLECLNMEQTLSVLHKMAQFHAASACRVAKSGSYPSALSPHLNSEMIRGMIHQLFMPFKKAFLDHLASYDNGEKYYDLLDMFFDNLLKLFESTRKVLPGYFSVLNHGDCWSSNILFKYNDDGKLEDTVFVDFQSSNWSSPALDLYYFIISSVQIDIKIAQFDYFIRYYYQHLIDHLKLLEYPLDIPNLSDFQMQLNDFGGWATVTSFFTLGFVLLDPKDSAKLENFLGDSEECYRYKSRMYSNERYRKYINEILPWLYNHGFMEIKLTDNDNRIAVADNLKKQAIKQLDSIVSNNYPEWVNESLFSTVVRADCKKCQKILKFAVFPAKNAGENYSSTLLKVDIDIELTDHTNRNLSYMLKVPPYKDDSKAATALHDAYEKEALAYIEIIPQLEKIYKEKASLDVVFAPKSFKLKHETRSSAIVLENLKIKNFENCDRLEGLDMKHTQVVLDKLAQLHAASACWFETEGIIPEIYKRPMFTEETKLERGKMAKSFLSAFLESVRQYEGNVEYINKVEHYVNNALAILIKASNIDNNKFNVLNHGDCWTNNIMFQHDDDGNIINSYFVDFQLAQYGSPSYDLFYFLLSSPVLELKMEHFDYFIHYYHEKLKSNLELLKYTKQIPTLKDFHQDLLYNGVWTFYTIMCVLPAILFEGSLDKFLADDDEDGLSLRKQMFLDKRYRSHVEIILPWLYRRGFLDFN